MLGDAITYCRRRLSDGAEALGELSYSTQLLRDRIDDSASAWSDERGRLLRDRDLQPHAERADDQLVALRRTLEACESVVEPLAAAAAQDEIVGTQVSVGHQAAANARGFAADARRSSDSARYDIGSAQSAASQARGMLVGL